MALSKVDLENQVENILPETLGGTGASQLPAQFRNIIINGDMSIAQRATSATGLGNGDSGYHTCDRWRFSETGSPTTEFTMSQSTDVPSGQGFATSLKMDCTTAQGSLASSDSIKLEHRIEGQNVQYLKKGTASAESITMSFWVKSNKTGTYIVEIFDNTNSRQISKSYTISSADTWEKKTIIFEGDTSGALANNNAISLIADFYLSAGSNFTSGTLSTSWESFTQANRAVGQVNLADSTANEWYITGVQLEVGSAASDFEFLPYDVNLQRCQRYYQLLVDSQNNKDLATGLYYTSGQIFASIDLKQVMRTTPSIDIETGTNYYISYSNGTADELNSFVLDGSSHNTSVELKNATEASGTAGYGAILRTNNASAFIAFDSEL